jgi:hypothetical protein
MGVIINSIKEMCSPSNLPQYSEMNAGVPVGFDNTLPEGEATVEATSVDMDSASLDLPCEETLKALGKLLNGLDRMFKLLLPRLFPNTCFGKCTEHLRIIRRLVPTNILIDRFARLVTLPRA